MSSMAHCGSALRWRRVRAASAVLLLSVPVNGCVDRVPVRSVTEIAFDSPSVRIGVADGEEPYLFQRIHSVILTADGDIVVGDQGPRVAVFDRGGSWLADLARRGSGPGEVQMIGGLWAGPGDTIVVWDAVQRKLAFIPRVSGEAREVRVPWGPRARPVDGIGGRAVFELETGQLRDTAQAVSRLVTNSGQDSSTIVGPYPVPEIGWKVMPNGVGHMVNAPIFESYAAWDVSAAGLWWADGVSSRLSLYSWTGERLAEIDLPVSDRPISGPDMEAYYAGMSTRWGADISPESGEGPPTAETAPRITRIVADDSGCVWLGDFDPGADISRNWAGSNYLVVRGRTRGGISVMQLLMQEVTGEPFPILMQRRVLGPLGTVHSTYEQPLPDAPGRIAATGHERLDTPVPGRFHTYPEMAAAGLWSTPSDLARWAIELQRAQAGDSSRVLSPEMTRQMLSPQFDAWGLGVQLVGSGDSTMFFHGGRDEGFVATLRAFVSRGQGMVLMTNGVSDKLLAEVARNVARVYGWSLPQRPTRTRVPVDSVSLSHLVGRYLLVIGRDTSTLEVTREAARLFIQQTGGIRGELVPQGELSFFDPDDGTDFVFVRDPAASAATLITIQMGNEAFTATRIPNPLPSSGNMY